MYLSKSKIKIGSLSKLEEKIDGEINSKIINLQNELSTSKNEINSNSQDIT